MKTNERSPRTGQRGVTLLEMSVSMSLLVVVLGSLAWAMTGLRGLVSSGKNRAALQTSGQLALVEMIEELRQSGIVELNAVRYPVVFEDGDPGENHPGLEHPVAAENAQAGEPDFGPDRELIFLRPMDADANRRPDLDVDGNLLWSAEEISYVVVTRPDGENYLERRVDGGNPRIVCRFVERLIIDDAETSGFEIPLGCVRIRLFLRKRDGQGTVHRYFTEGIVALRNG
jgi:prepilin-type N-terminal cleavage/methylation domain-containing protein